MIRTNVINYNLGNLADWLSAIGTIGAVVISLYLLFKEREKRISIVAKVSYYDSIEQTDNGVTKIIKKNKIDVYVINKGYLPITLFFEGIRVERKLRFKKNITINIPQINKDGTQDLITLNGGQRSESFEFDLDTIKLLIAEQVTSSSEKIFIEFVFKDDETKNFYGKLPFMNPDNSK